MAFSWESQKKTVNVIIYNAFPGFSEMDISGYVRYDKYAEFANESCWIGGRCDLLSGFPCIVNRIDTWQMRGSIASTQMMIDHHTLIETFVESLFLILKYLLHQVVFGWYTKSKLFWEISPKKVLNVTVIQDDDHFWWLYL